MIKQKFVQTNSPESIQQFHYSETPPLSPFILKAQPQKQFSIALHEASPEPSATKYINQIHETFLQQKQKLELCSFSSPLLHSVSLSLSLSRFFLHFMFSFVILTTFSSVLFFMYSSYTFFSSVCCL
jgi:hypothetical protein